MNNVVLSGYLNYTKVSKTQTGKTKFVGNIAVYRNKENNNTIYDYIRFNSYDEVADRMSQYQDGDQVLISGVLRHQKYEENGQTKYIDFVLVNHCGLISRKDTPVSTQYEEPYLDVEQIEIDPNSLPF